MDYLLLIYNLLEKIDKTKHKYIYYILLGFLE